eukprot:TRINITY_DN1918_c0_g1_i1.p1 TRINITY_DN1918_c0_g1~~TRINITY_DN1918_c0_g1_i1.p1  ORF type:complete len:116 (-),score=31.02 TRINITY_DN1918_c0_g1_i1:96-401(-)
MEIFTGEQDFVGQQLAESHFTKILNVFAVIGWIVGFFLQSFKYTFYIIAAGAVLSVIVAVPAWPMYRQNPLKWLPNLPKEDATVATKSPEAGKKKESKKQR